MTPNPTTGPGALATTTLPVVRLRLADETERRVKIVEATFCLRSVDATLRAMADFAMSHDRDFASWLGSRGIELLTPYGRQRVDGQVKFKVVE